MPFWQIASLLLFASVYICKLVRKEGALMSVNMYNKNYVCRYMYLFSEGYFLFLNVEKKFTEINFSR